ncbi:MAG: O-antigen ligase family protein [Patescibacteria group bacterium]
MFKKLDSIAFSICAILLALLPFHAFLFTWFHSFFWQESWVIVVQAWKEVLVGILAVFAIVKLIQTRQAPCSKSFWIGTVFVVLAVLYALFDSGELIQRVFGLRTAVIFLIAFLSIQFFDFGGARTEKLKKIVLISSGIVIAFALLQKFILPADFLANFGYSTNVSSWLPGGNLPIYHTVGDSGTIRAQSTFAGPNQLGAYLLVILPLAFVAFRKEKKFFKYLAAMIFIGGAITLALTFSRSAWVGAFAMLLALAVSLWRQGLPRKLKRKLAIGGVIGIIVVTGATIFQPSFREIFLRQASTSEHLARSVEAAKVVLVNPLGLGLGQSAGVSQRFDPETHTGITPENTYLGTAIELGWLGGILLLALIFTLLRELAATKNPLFYSLLGIAVVALFLHPLEDTPTALTLFLLAGVMLQPPLKTNS